MACPSGATASTEAELMKKVATHAATVHNIKTIPPDMMMKITNEVKEQLTDSVSSTTIPLIFFETTYRSILGFELGVIFQPG